MFEPNTTLPTRTGDGNPTNTSSWGRDNGAATAWQTTATAFSPDGNQIWSLTAQNRVRAISTSPAVVPKTNLIKIPPALPPLGSRPQTRPSVARGAA